MIPAMKYFNWTAWLSLLNSANRQSGSRKRLAAGSRRRHSRRSLAVSVEWLEVRELLTVDPITLADSSLFGQTGDGTSRLHQDGANISADGQLVVFESDANDLVPNDSNGASNNTNPLTDVFLYNRATGQTSLISVNLAGTSSGNGTSNNAKISPDGRYVLFESTANNLTSEIKNQFVTDIFLRDLQSGTTTLVSKSLAGTNAGDGGSREANISSDGRYVAFSSGATNLVADDTNGGVTDIFLRDLVNGTTQLVSHKLGDATAGGDSASVDPRISDDGRFVAFVSSASDLVLDDRTVAMHGTDIFTWDRQTGAIELLSVSSDGVNQAIESSFLSPGRALSADGRYVLFETPADNLVPQNAGVQGTNVYLRDRQLGTTVAVTLSANGLLATGGASATMTPDGRYVAFVSSETDLVAGVNDTNGTSDVFLRDMQTGMTKLVSRNAAGDSTGNSSSGVASYPYSFSGGALVMSDDARYVAFVSAANNLVPGVVDANDGLTDAFGAYRRDVFVRDTVLDTTNLISRNVAGTATGSSGSFTPAMSADGRVVAFESLANDLVAGQDGLLKQDVFVRDVTAGRTDLASQRTPLFPEWRLRSAGGLLDDATPDGRFVTFSTYGGGGIFVRDRTAGTVEEVTVQPNGAAGYGTQSRISADGRFVVFQSNLVLATDGSSSTDYQIWIRDLLTKQTRLVSVNPAGKSAQGSVASDILLTPDGRYVAWTSSSQDLVPNFVDGNGNNAPYGGFLDVFIRDLYTGVTRLVSHVPDNAGQSGNGYSTSPIFSADGSLLIFKSQATDLVVDLPDVNNTFDVFAYEVATGAIELVTVNTGGTGAGNQTSEHAVEAVVSADGRYVAVSSNAIDLATGTVSGRFGRLINIVVRDLLTNTTTLVSANMSGTSSGDSSSYSPSISADGRYVAFASDASDLVSGDTGLTDVFVRDLQTNTTTRVSVTPVGGQADSHSFQQLISPDGRRVSFYSRASNLVANFVDVNGGFFGGGDDLFVRDLETGVTDHVSVNDSGTATGNNDASPGNQRLRIFTANGETLFFNGNPSDLVVADRNATNDVFAYTFEGAGQIRGSLFNDTDRDGTQDADEAALAYWTVYLDANSNGRFDEGERNVRSDLAGNYALTGLDAGAYAVGLVLPDGYARTTPVAQSTYSVILGTATSVITGRDFGAAAAQVDLQVSGVSGPQSIAAGRPFDVSWIVHNLGDSAAAGSWQDGVYLSRDTVLDISDTLVGVVSHTGGLASHTNYSGSLTVDAAAQLQGTFYVLVQTDRRRQVSVDLNLLNNVATSGAIQVTLPQLVVGTPFTDSFAAANQERYFQFTVTPGQSLILTLDSAAASGSTELYLRRGQLPTPWDFDLTSRTPSEPDQKLFVPVTQAGTYYVLVQSRAGSAATSAFTVTAALPGLKIENVSTNVGGNTGRVTVKIEGSGFTPSTIASLVNGTTAIDATFVDYRSPSLIYATFDLVGKSIGDYDVRVRDGLRANTSPNAFDIVQGDSIGIDVDVQLLAPEAARATAGTAVGVDTRPLIVVTYENKGNVDAAAPLFQLTTDFGKLDIQQHTVTGENGALTFLGVGADGPAGILRPGDKGRIEARLTLPIVVAHAGSQATITLSSSSLTSSDQPKGLMINWTERKADVQPDFIGDEAWDPIWANFVEVVGTTTDDLQTLLANDATYLGRLGVDTANTSDLSTLFGFELKQADAALPFPILASAVDAAFPTSGLELGFGRAFLQPISGRYRLGALGRGWVHGWEVSASTDTFGNVRVDAAGTYRNFSILRDGNYLSAPGDTGVLTFADGVYHLGELDGTTTTFRTDGKIDFVQEPHGTRVTAGYDSDGRLDSLTHSTGPVLTIAYNAQGRISTVTDPTGRSDFYTYDASGEHLLSVTDQDGTTRYTYVTGQGAASEHALASIENTDLTHLFVAYDAHGRLSGESRDGGGEAVSYEYGSAGELTITDASGAKTLLLFDQNGQLRQIRDPLDRQSSFEYDGTGDLVAYVSPTGLQWTYDHDARGNVVHSIDPLGHELRMTYDAAFDNLTSLTDAKGNTTQYGYDATGDLRNITYPNGSQEAFDYDPLGNLSESINRRGRAIGYQYDAHGLPTKKTYADESEINFTYDAHGNLKTAVDAHGTISLDYDTADRLTKITYPGGRFLGFTYDAGGRRTKSVDQDGFTVNYAYDALGRLFKLTDGGGATVVAYSFDEVGRLSRKDLGNGTFTTYDYDPAGQLLNLINHAPSGDINSSFAYTYDAEGRSTSVTTADGMTSYEYDLLGQLTKVALPGGRTIEYVYDAAGNRVSVTDGGVTTDYLTNNLNQYTQVGATTFTYDADGNVVGKTDGTSFTSYTFDDDSHLIGSSGPDGDWNYVYNSLGDRSASIHDGFRTDYLVDPVGLGDVIAEYGGDGLIAHYAHGLGLVNRTTEGGSSVYYDFDAIGNTTGLTNAAGTYVNCYSYLPFGETTTVAATVSNPFTFVGEFGVMTAGGGLQFMRFRYYDTERGHFGSDDPLGVTGGDSNVRRYVGNSPTNGIDPLGLATPTPPNGPSPQNPFDPHNPALPNQPLNPVPDRIPPKNPNPPNIKPPPLTGQKPIPNEAAKRLLKQVAAIEKALDNKIARDVAFSESRRVFGGLGGWAARGAGRISPFLAWGDFFYRTHSILTDPNSPFRKIKIQKTIQFPSSFDPNDISGQSGFGTQHFVSTLATLPYTIRFENAANLATAPAQEVFVTHQLDTDLDWSLVELDDIGFGDVVVDVPEGLQSYKTRVAYKNQDGSDLFVDVEINFDLSTGLLTWILRSVDPLTGALPLGVFDGFLYVNDATHHGEGFVRYLVRTKAALATGTTIDQQASIVFDVNAPIETNVFTNTIDAGTPVSSVNPLASITSVTDFLVSWSGTDDVGGSGLASFDILVSDNNGPYTLWLNDTTQTSANFAGQFEHSYRFYALAQDNVGHVEPAPATADASTLVKAVPQLLQEGPAVTWVNKKPATIVLPLITVANTPLGGGILTISMNAAGSKKKASDVLSNPPIIAIGTSSGLVYANGKLTLQVQLSQNVTAGAIQTFLRGITFSTKGNGLKLLTRTVNVSLAVAGLPTSVVMQTIHVRKKA
jgi:RHS repeat-associated protein